MAGHVGLNENEEYVYRISTADEWSKLQTSGCTFGQQLDKDSRYIHLSKLNQVKLTLERFYMNATSDLFLLQIDCKKLGDGLLYEDVDGSNIFPHFYGPSRSYVPLNLDMVVKAERIISSNGQFIWWIVFLLWCLFMWDVVTGPHVCSDLLMLLNMFTFVLKKITCLAMMML